MTRKRTSPSTVLLFALAALLVVLCIVFRQPISGLLWRGLAPILSARDSWSAGTVAQLQAKLASTSAALADRNALAAENAQLRAELGRPDSVQKILAAVLEQPPGTPYDTLVVDAGKAEGVVLGARVSAGALAVGTVDEVQPHSSRVVLYSAPGQTYQAVLLSAGASVPVAIEGQGGGSLVGHVPAATAVAVGDTVQFPELGGDLVGTVSAVTGSESETFKTIYLRLPVNVFELRFVYIQK